jgi:DNA-binding winged helix-turn-helix (wHTH) protein
MLFDVRYRFADFTLDSGTRELSSQGSSIHISPKAFRLLELLLAAAPNAVSRDDLYAGLWPDTFVDEANLPNLVKELRKALSDDSRNPRFIKTLHGFGYAFSERATSDAAPAWSIYTLQWSGRDLRLPLGETVLGRDETCDVRVESPGVSRRHAVITATESGAAIRDLESKNGTFVEGVRIEDAADLADAQELRLGSAVLRVRKLAATQSTMTVAPPLLEDET